MSWLDDLIGSYVEYESPSRYYYWSGLAAVSAVLKDHVWIDRGKLYKLYPNVYILLYGPSGIRKGPPIAAAEKLVKLVKVTRVINGRSTLEAILKELGTSYTQPDKTIIKDSCGFISASELSSSIVSNPSAMDVMTALYDRIYNEGEWKYRLKVGESSTLNNPTITWLTASNEALFKEFIPEKNIKGGLFGRMFIINETKINKPNSLMYDPLVVPDYAKLAIGLKEISKLKGEFTILDPVRKSFHEFYLKFTNDIKPKLDDETGLAQRMDDLILKVAMLISCARRGDMIINGDDILEATNECIPLITPTKRLANTINKKDSGMVEKRLAVLNYLVQQNGNRPTREETLRALSMKLNHEELDSIVSTFTQMRVMRQDARGDTIIYELNDQNEKVKDWIEKNRN